MAEEQKTTIPEEEAANAAEETSKEKPKKEKKPKKNAELEKLYVPKTVTLIEKGAFDGCETLNTVIFEHSEDEFKKITVEEDLSRFELVFDFPFSETEKEGQAK